MATIQTALFRGWDKCGKLVPLGRVAAAPRSRKHLRLWRWKRSGIMERQLLSLMGNATKHVLGGIVHALRAIVLAFIIVAVLAAGATVGLATVLTKQFPPSGPTYLAAAALAIAFGYAAAITVAVEEILRTIIRAFEVVIQEAEKLGKEAVQEAEKMCLGRGRAARS